MFPMALSRGLPLRQFKVLNYLHSFRYKSSKPDFENMVKKNKVVVFMKGTPNAPRCGFSATVVKLFKMYGVKYEAYDVLSDEEIRQGIKEYTSWPTIPQVFLNGEFVGGCDILLQMHLDKKLSEELKKAGVEYGQESGEKS